MNPMDNHKADWSVGLRVEDISMAVLLKKNLRKIEKVASEISNNVNKQMWYKNSTITSKQPWYTALRTTLIAQAACDFIVLLHKYFTYILHVYTML